jgi:CubicO group peptidase (beta-lactamase class C family)
MRAKEGHMHATASAEQVSEIVQAAMQRFHVPGVAIGILHAGEEQVAGFGITSIEHPLPVDADTLFQIGSITKTVTATAIMRLVEKGTLVLDTPIRAYLPDLCLTSEETAARVTLRHLLTHMGGWVGDYFDDLGPGDEALAAYVANMVDLPQITPLGAIWHYNNAGFSLAGRVVEAVTGQTYEAAIARLVLEPLGMTRSFFFAADVITHRVAIGHLIRDDSPEVARPWALARTAHAAGGLISSVRDLLRYARFHLGDGSLPDGTRMLTSETMELMRSPLAEAGSITEAVGLAWLLRTMDGTQIVMHGGATHGQQAVLMLVPTRQFAIVVLTNANRGSALHGEVTRWATRHFLGLSQESPAQLDLSPEQLAAYAGRYSARLSDLELRVEAGDLVLQVIPKGGFPLKDSPPPPAPPPVRLAVWAEDRVIALDDPMQEARGEFLRDPDGRLIWLRWSGRLHARQ